MLPHVRGPVFALQRDPNSGEARESAVRANQWEISAAPEQYRLRMGWWWLTPGQRVFSLVMGRHPAYEDQVLYHVHPSRYTVATVDWFQGPDRHSKTPYFDWLINVDGVGVDIRGGVYGIARDGWHVFSDGRWRHTYQVAKREQLRQLFTQTFPCGGGHGTSNAPS